MNDKKIVNQIDKQDIKTIGEAIEKRNSEFSECIMSFLQKYQILSDQDIEILTSRADCRELFHSDYPILLKIDTEKSISSQIKDKTGRNRYYSSMYELNNGHYVMTSQLYGLGDNPSHQDNRTPLLKWVQSIVLDIDGTVIDYDENKKMSDSIKDKVLLIERYIVGQGFSYNEGLIKDFYLSLKSKPFVILAGTSGTGKTRLVKLFSEAIGAEYMMVPVRPDWSDSTDLFGHVDLNGRFIPGAILDYISEAQKNLNKPYILCLDEMNLARVEYYLSDFLSIMETREYKDGHIVSDPLVSREKYGADKDSFEQYGELGLPENLYLVGTVNMDETTFSFSKKVLDRANTIEFNYVDLVPSGFDSEAVEPMSLNNDFLKTGYLLLVECKGSDEFINDTCVELQSINKILQNANAHIGYRVRDEIVFYMLNNMESDLLSRDEAFDNEIMQKVLPRIQGSSSSIRDVLCELFKVFAGDYDGYQLKNEISVKMFEKLKNADAKYPKSAEKIAFMTRRFEEDGFTSYWL